jgi:putative ubiquitin-RnfH superfamily antitoxin RatB of RatAB toxin-antitoxin module
MAPAEPAPALRVEVVYCPGPGRVDLSALTLPDGATVQDALRESGVVDRNALDTATLRLGVWCKTCEPGRALRDGDRVEIYRPLTVDPKEARRLRYRRRGTRDEA